jgi:hypothetical protein
MYSTVAHSIKKRLPPLKIIYQSAGRESTTSPPGTREKLTKTTQAINPESIVLDNKGLDLFIKFPLYMGSFPIIRQIDISDLCTCC